MKLWNQFVVLGLAAALSGCCCAKNCQQNADQASPCGKRVVISVPTVTGAFRLDGKLDDAVWQKADKLPLHRVAVQQAPLMEARIAKDGYESGYAMFSKDDKYLYVAAKFTDSDVLQYGDEDQLPLWRHGDLLEVFLGTENSSGYWELFAAPNGKKTTIFFPSPGMRVFTKTNRDMPGMDVAAQVQGTLNLHDDVDQGWTVEMQIPIAEVEKACGVTFSADQKWVALAARYNYGKRFRIEQNSTYPKLPLLSFHLLEYYGLLSF